MSIVSQRVVTQIVSDIKEDDPWAGSPNEDIRQLTSSKKGKVGATIAKHTLESFVEAASIGPGAPAFDVSVDRLKVEIKMSTRWGNGKYKFQQLRKFHAFDRCIFVAVHPDEVRIWWATRADLDKHVFSNDKLKQHGGAGENSGTYWLSIGEEPLDWFRDMEEWQLLDERP